jgi:thioredoxin-related protein
LFIGTFIEAKDTININNIIENASKKDRHVLLFLHITYCGYCKRMQKITFQDKNVQKFIKKDFIFVDINIDDNQNILFNNQSYSKKEFSDSFDIDLFPTVLFFDKANEVTYTVRGYRNSEKFMQILEFIQTKSYKNIDFFDYKHKKLEKE